MEIYAVRGPRSMKRAHQLGYECPDIFGDPAIVLPKVYAPIVERKYRLGIIPHYSDFEKVSLLLQHRYDLHVVDVTQSVETVISEILSCEATLASSLHGLIVSHAYGLRSTWIASEDRLIGDNIKFVDYLESVGLYGMTEPETVDWHQSADKLENLATHQFNVEQERLSIPLLEACPFLEKTNE
ncbi:polysaccharide pyruvyl transferase family protein [Spiribacter vilamensis]|uniref:polysaccharide pyruvyl transferase family protein n=1 Tax=Spiribacter vilamensis TaxID=531306 RepID=UPI001B878A5B|nr:polysaccharide pyruvyl transferase family protein [Spiribacter vilamensis]